MSRRGIKVPLFATFAILSKCLCYRHCIDSTDDITCRQRKLESHFIPVALLNAKNCLRHYVTQNRFVVTVSNQQ